jgi:hypothetical protein
MDVVISPSDPGAVPGASTKCRQGASNEWPEAEHVRSGPLLTGGI